jgi:hypothetical protein
MAFHRSTVDNRSTVDKRRLSEEIWCRFDAGLYRYLVLICATWCDVENEDKYMCIRCLFDDMQCGAAGCIEGSKRT